MLSSQPYKLMTICYYFFIDLPSYWIFYCHERSEVTLFIFNGIPMHLIRLNGSVQNLQEGGRLGVKNFY